MFLHAHLQVVYYKCVKFHKNPISRLGGVALTRYMDRRTDGQGDSYIPPPKKNLCLRGVLRGNRTTNLWQVTDQSYNYIHSSIPIFVMHKAGIKLLPQRLLTDGQQQSCLNQQHRLPGHLGPHQPFLSTISLQSLKTAQFYRNQLVQYIGTFFFIQMLLKKNQWFQAFISYSNQVKITFKCAHIK